MVEMNQEKLNRMCKRINAASELYAYNITATVNTVVDWFNENWISTSSKQFAANILDNLNTLTVDILNVLRSHNKHIRRCINKYNETSQQPIYYRGFSLEYPNVNALTSLNQYLPNGKIGIIADANEIYYPINSIRDIVEQSVTSIKNAIVKSDALSYDEQQSMQIEIIKAENKFNDTLDNMQLTITHKINEQLELNKELDKTNKNIIRDIYF